MTDTFGRIMFDALEGKEAKYSVERDDGFITTSTGHQYIVKFEDWAVEEKLAAEEIEGPVLDVGCGAGRVGIYAKKQGIEYVGVDLSEMAIAVCRQRGLQDVHVMSADKIELDRSDFKTIVLFGNNFGIMGTIDSTIRMLQGFHGITSDDAIILAGSIDPEETDNKVHISYHSKNKARGKPLGQVRLRNKYQGEVDDWWYLLLCGKELMSELAEQAGWVLERVIGGPKYNVGVLKKKMF